MELGDSLKQSIYSSVKYSVWFSVDAMVDEFVRDVNGKSKVDDLVSISIWGSVGISVCDSVYDSLFTLVGNMNNKNEEDL